MSDTTVATPVKEQKNPFAPKPKPALDPNIKKWLIQTEGLGHDLEMGETSPEPEMISESKPFEIPMAFQKDWFKSFETKEPVSTDIPPVYQSDLKPETVSLASESKPTEFSGTIHFTDSPKTESPQTAESTGSVNFQSAPEIKLGEAFSSGVQGGVKAATEAISTIGGGAKDTVEATADLAKFILGVNPEIKKDHSKEDPKKAEQQIVFQHTRSFNEQINSGRHQIDMTLKMKEALRIIDKPDMSEEEAVALGFNANVNKSEFLMNAYGLQSMRNKMIEMQKIQEKRKTEESIKSSKPAVVLAGMNEGGTAGGKVNMSAANAAG